MKPPEEWSGKQWFVVITLAVVIITALVIMMASIYMVPAGHKGVVVSGFNIGTELDEGFNWKFFLDKVEDVRSNTQSWTETISVKSSDQINMDLDITVRYHLNPGTVGELRVQNGEDFREVLIDPIGRSVPRNIATSNNFTMLTIIEKRVLFEEMLQAEITILLGEKSIIVEDVLLRNIELPAQVEDAIEKKKASEQDIETAKNRLEAEQFNAEQEVVRAIAEANATVVLARGQAEALRVLAEQGGNISDNVMTYILSLRYISMLKDPESNVQFVVVPMDQALILNVEELQAAAGA